MSMSYLAGVRPEIDSDLRRECAAAAQHERVTEVVKQIYRRRCAGTSFACRSSIKRAERLADTLYDGHWCDAVYALEGADIQEAIAALELARGVAISAGEQDEDETDAVAAIIGEEESS